MFGQAADKGKTGIKGALRNSKGDRPSPQTKRNGIHHLFDGANSKRRGVTRGKGLLNRGE